MTATEFRAKCLGLMDEVAETGREIVITKRDGWSLGWCLIGGGRERRLVCIGIIFEFTVTLGRRSIWSGTPRCIWIGC